MPPDMPGSVPHLNDANRVSWLWNRLGDFAALNTELLDQIPELELWIERHGGPPWVELASGSGGGIIPDVLAAAMTESAVRTLYFEGIDIELSTLGPEIDRAIRRLSHALEGAPVESVEVIGLSGIRLEAGVEIDTPWGRIVAAAEPARTAASNSAFAQTTHAILVRSIGNGLKLHAKAPEFPTAVSTASDVQDWRVLLLFSLRLALGPIRNLGASYTFVSEVNPFVAGQGATWSLRLDWGSPLPIDAAAAREIEEWSTIVAENHVPSMDVSARRLALLDPSRDASDRLIDAVIAWENLFGSSSETTFKVTGSLAKLLCAEPEQRQNERKRMSAIYSLRSKIVHGAATRAGSVDSSADEALEVAIRGLRASYLRGRSWLEMTSEERAHAVLMLEA